MGAIKTTRLENSAYKDIGDIPRVLCDIQKSNIDGCAILSVPIVVFTIEYLKAFIQTLTICNVPIALVQTDLNVKSSGYELITSNLCSEFKIQYLLTDKNVLIRGKKLRDRIIHDDNENVDTIIESSSISDIGELYDNPVPDSPTVRECKNIQDELIKLIYRLISEIKVEILKVLDNKQSQFSSEKYYELGRIFSPGKTCPTTVTMSP